MGCVQRRRFLIAVALLAAPLAAVAQQPGKVWRIGFLALSFQPEYVEAFRKGMRDLGYVEGRNLVIEWRYADGKLERMPELAGELVQLKVDVIVASASVAIGAAQKVTSTIPIVMTTTGDPVGAGFVKSLAHPGGNITGLSNMRGDLAGKHVDILLAVVPKLSRLGLLVTPTSTTTPSIVESVPAAARKAGLTMVVARASTPQEIDAAFALLSRENMGAVVMGSGPFFNVHRTRIAELGIRYRLPIIFGNRLYVEAGGLMSYGQKLDESYVRAASYVNKILRGAKPGDLPVEQPVTLEFVINEKTAKALGLTIPPSLLARADEVIQ